MRFFARAGEAVNLSAIEDALTRVDAGYSVTDRASHPREVGTLIYKGGIYGQIEINRRGDGLFEEEIEEFKEGLEEARGKGKRKIREILDAAKAIVAIQILFQDRETEETLRRIDPIWYWLFENGKGLLQVDAEGWYNEAGPILRSE